MGAVATAAAQLELLRGELVAVVRAEIAAAVPAAAAAAAAAATTAVASKRQDPVDIAVRTRTIKLLARFLTSVREREGGMERTRESEVQVRACAIVQKAERQTAESFFFLSSFLRAPSLSSHTLVSCECGVHASQPTSS